MTKALLFYFLDFYPYFESLFVSDVFMWFSPRFDFFEL